MASFNLKKSALVAAILLISLNAPHAQAAYWGYLFCAPSDVKGKHMGWEWLHTEQNLPAGFDTTIAYKDGKNLVVNGSHSILTALLTPGKGPSLLISSLNGKSLNEGQARGVCETLLSFCPNPTNTGYKYMGVSQWGGGEWNRVGVLFKNAPEDKYDRTMLCPFWEEDKHIIDVLVQPHCGLVYGNLLESYKYLHTANLCR